MKFPVQGQPNPKKFRLEVAFGSRFFPQQLFFRGLGLILYTVGNRLQETQPNQILRKQPTEASRSGPLSKDVA